MPVKFEDAFASNMESHGHSEKPIAAVPSILETMKIFISAVEDMDETVLIPSRLRDMPAGHVSSTQGMVPVTPENGTNGTILQSKEIIPHIAPQQADAKNTNDISLYSHYSILKALRTELVSGPSAEEDLRMDEEDDIASKKLQIATARMFRHHLNGVVNTMQQLTLMCDKVTNQYRSEFDDNQANKKVNTFSM